MFINNLVKTGLLERSLDASALRDEALNQNMANVDTPNYKRKQVKFEEFLKDAQDTGGLKGNKTDSRHITIGEPDYNSIVPSLSEDSHQGEMRIDGNNVDINVEMSDLAKNSIKFNVLTQRISGQFKLLKSVISEGRK